MTLEKLAEMISSQDSTISTLDSTITTLATIMAKRFDTIENKFDTFQSETKDNFEKVEQNFEKIRGDMLNQGDKFVAHSTFEAHVARFNVLEEKVKAKIK